MQPAKGLAVGMEFSGVEVNASVLGTGATLTWAKTAGDEAVARAVITFLEDRRLLFGDRHMEDEMHCVRSAVEIRAFLTEQIVKSKPGKQLDESLRAMRAACRQFVDKAGLDGVHFQHRGYMHEVDRFSLALGDLRSLVGVQLAALVQVYDLPIEPDLARILPPRDQDDEPQDLSWIPGFED